MKINPCLVFDGKCEEAFKFYQECFGGKIVAMMPYGVPEMAGHVPEGWDKKIIHARLYVGDQVLMGSDSPPDRYHKTQGMDVALHFETPAEADRVFSELSQGGEITMPIGETFFASKFGMLTDRYGTPWMVVCEKASVPA